MEWIVTRLVVATTGEMHRVSGVAGGGSGLVDMVRRGPAVLEGPIELNLRDLLDFVRRGLLWAAIAASIGGAIAFVLTSRIEPTYRAVATLGVPSTPAFGTVLVTAPSLDAGTCRTAILSRAVIEPAIAILAADGIDTGAAWVVGRA